MITLSFLEWMIRVQRMTSEASVEGFKVISCSIKIPDNEHGRGF